MPWNFIKFEEDSLIKFVAGDLCQPVLYVDPEAEELEIKLKNPRLNITPFPIWDHHKFAIAIPVEARMDGYHGLLNMLGSNEVQDLLARISTGYSLDGQRKGNLDDDAYEALGVLERKIAEFKDEEYQTQMAWELLIEFPHGFRPDDYGLAVDLDDGALGRLAMDIYFEALNNKVIVDPEAILSLLRVYQDEMRKEHLRDSSLLPLSLTLSAEGTKNH